MTQPELLKRGDLVAIAAPARAVAEAEMEAAVALLEHWGLRVLLPEGLYSRADQFAGSDAHRAAVLQQLLDNDEVRAIFCARGGYGSVRIVDRLDFSRFCQRPKWVVGYSDVTVLHSHIVRNCHVDTIHGIMPINIPADATTVAYPAIDSLHQLLFDGHVSYHFVHNDDSCPNRTGSATAPVVGGNLSLIYSLLGSVSDIDTDGAILLIEDLDEYLYHIDRMMHALRRAGKLEGLKGLIVGSLSDMHDNAIPFGRDAEAIVREAVDGYTFPVAYHVPIGHIGTQNHALALGQTATIEIHEKEVFITQ